MSKYFLSDLPSCPSTFSDALNVTIATPPLWLKPVAAMRMASLPRYAIDKLIAEKRVKTAWRPSKTGRLMPLIYGPSLWAYLDALAAQGERSDKEDAKEHVAESGPAKQEEAQ